MSLKNNAPAVASRGLITAEIGGQPRTFKFGMTALASYLDLYPEKGVNGMYDALNRNPLRFCIDMAYCGLLQRAAANRLPEDFSPELVGDWITEMFQADWNEVQAVMLAALTPGKPATEAPKPA